MFGYEKAIENKQKLKEHYHCIICGRVIEESILFINLNKEGKPVCELCVIKAGLKAIKK